MNSLPTVTHEELKNINPVVLVRIIHSIHRLATGTGYGKIQIFMQNGRITMIEGLESNKVEENVIVDKLDGS